MAPILVYFNLEREIIVEADLSGYATGGLILQKDNYSIQRPIAYLLKKYSPTKANYPIYNKEFLTIIYYLKIQQPELQVIKYFIVLIDYKNLKYFYSKK